jgi:6-phosphogluconolactonase
VNELDEFDGQPVGAVSAFSIDTNGKLKLLIQRPSMGKGPCYAALDREGRNLLVANYRSGSVAVIPVGRDGKLGEATEVVQHCGKSVHPERQNGPNPHCAVPDPANRYVFVCDLGLDKIMAYRFDSENGKLAPHDPAFIAMPLGSGPRHSAPDHATGVSPRRPIRIRHQRAELHHHRFRLRRRRRNLEGSSKRFDAAGLLGGPEHGGGDRHSPSGKYLFTSNRGHSGGLGGMLETGRSLDYLYAGDDNRRLCSLYLSIMDRMGVKLDHFGDAETRLRDL